MMNATPDHAIELLVAGFEACTLPKATWTHQAHLTVALWYLRRHGRDRAAQLLRTNIPRYNNSVGGSPDGYHETITMAWVGVIAGFLLNHDHGQPFADLRTRLIDNCGSKDYLLRYYSREVLLSDNARRNWVAPDVAPLP